MRAAKQKTKSSLTLIALLLAIGLLCAQWAGLAHRIIHAGWQQNAEASIYSELSEKSHHSCLAFDAATLADSVYTVPFAVPLLPNAHTLALWIAFASWDAPFIAHFSSRAPPLV